MQFEPVDPKQPLASIEPNILEYWQEEGMFKRSVEKNPVENSYHFYDGPPFVTGMPHYGSLLSSIIKDVVPRYQTMRGKRVERVWGWDCHGLPIEEKVQKQMGLENNKQIEAAGVHTFIAECYKYTSQTSSDWQWYIDRIGRWVDMDNCYKTMDNDYMESVMWVFKTLYDKGHIYRGKRVSWYSWKLGTPISSFEIAMDDSYETVSEAAITVGFPITTEGNYKNMQLLAWTTTPWTMPMHMAIAVHQDLEYSAIEYNNYTYIVASNRVESVFTGKEYKILSHFSGSNLVGLSYQSPFDFYTKKVDQEKNFTVYHGSFVTDEDGTGIAHEAPAHGDVDFQLAKEHGIHITEALDASGLYTSEVPTYEGRLYSNCIEDICEALKDKQLLFKKESITHRIPFCPRSHTPLIQKAQDGWFINVQNLKEKLYAANEDIYWFPEHFKHGRFLKSMEGAPDWSISRTRYWGTPMPVWQNQTTHETVVLNSRDELRQKVPGRITKITCLRHGESEKNIKKIHQSIPPGPSLTVMGQRQAEQAAKEISTDIDVIITSPLHRCKQTAAAVAKSNNIVPIVDDRITERQAGILEGQPVRYRVDQEFNINNRAKLIINNWPEDSYFEEGMENRETVQARVDAFMEEIMNTYEGQHIVLVTHGDILKRIKQYITAQDSSATAKQTMATFAVPKSYYWDNERNAEFNLHKDVLDTLTWQNTAGETYERIPEVLDCWVESASMPWAQNHYPFENKKQTEATFPADFIAEYTGQIRAWFYVMHVLAVALNESPSFKNVIVTGVINGTDGRKMSKSFKNYPDPKETIIQYGADAIRFYLLSTPVLRGEDINFTQQGIDEALKRILLPLWNTYSFFVTYANAADFSPKMHTSTHALDIWILTEVQDVCNRMTKQLDAYDLSACCQELDATIEALTNWYVRLSRKRFAGKEGDAAKQDALQTLYTVLVEFTKLLAPICPFISEHIYTQLTQVPHDSVHLQDWPEVRSLTSEQSALLTKTRLLRTVVSLGLSVRGEASVKNRQPLASATIALPPHLQTIAQLNEADIQLLKQELNVKEIEITLNPEELATTIVLVDARAVGPRLGKRVQQIIALGKNGDFTINDDGSFTIDGEVFTNKEAQLVYRGKEDGNIAAKDGIVVHLDTHLTEELIVEGTARDLIRTIQRLRKEAGFAFTDLVTVHIDGAKAAQAAFSDLIASETNSVLKVNNGAATVVEIDGEAITISIQ